ncbi:hypothetical protein C8F04DRAFT_1321577 [Mycena alexandri]|uniref:Uncharacterized protein n=1 Tax=Mycena alexandri TaxID=1745969 RepID=A0AAD6T7U6_9AGAR|nr:hypothetical protein C8F04DRAFT_1321577 [Mycena alexandri]
MTESPTSITPDGPTVLDGVSVLTLDHLDVFGYNAANSYVIPEIIDVDRFHGALAKTLVLFPLYATRASCAEDGRAPWTLVLPPKGIPVTVSVSDETQIVPVEAVVQKPLRFLPPLSPRKIVLDPTTPVAAILLTKFPNLGVTSIGITRWHPIGSDYVASCFIRTLSKFYIGVPDDESVAPVYKAARSYLPAPDRTCLEGIDTYAVETYYSARSWHSQLDPSQPANVRLDFRLSATQTQQLRDAIHGLGGENTSFLTAQDCIVSLIALATNAADLSNPPIHSIDTILDVRGTGDIPPTLGFNGFVFAPTDRVIAANADDYYAYALAVRQSIIRGRTPNFLAALADLQAARAAEGTNRGEVMDLASPPGRMLCNSTLRLDKVMRPDIHFGHPGKTKSYVGTVPFVRHLKLARPNPRMNADGTWSSGLEDTEVTLYFQPLVRGRFIEEINGRLRALKVEGAAEWIGI